MRYVPKHQLVYSGAAIIAATYGFARYNYGLFLPVIRNDFNVTTTVLGLIASGSYAGYLTSTMISALITVRTGPRLPSILGGMCACLGMGLVAASTSTWLLATGVIIAGSGAGWVYPAMPEAVIRVIPVQEQNRSLTWINAGTSFGVLLSGPIALFLSSTWRIAWCCFVCLSFLVTVWNWRVLPGKGVVGKAVHETRGCRLFCSQARPLFATAFLLGFITSVYWTFSVDVVLSAEGTLSSGIGQVFWVVVGISGVAGVTAGDLIERFGSHRFFVFTCVELASAFIVLSINPGFLLLSFCSAALFGTGYFLITGLLAVWSVRVFRSRASLGLGMTFWVLSLGQIIGPSVFGILNAIACMRLLFGIGGVLVFCLLLFHPQNEV